MQMQSIFKAEAAVHISNNSMTWLTETLQHLDYQYGEFHDNCRNLGSHAISCGILTTHVAIPTHSVNTTSNLCQMCVLTKTTKSHNKKASITCFLLFISNAPSWHLFFASSCRRLLLHWLPSQLLSPLIG